MKRISLGTSNFKEIIDNDNYFIDKTLIVKEFLEDSGKIILLPRPRRFGKTLNMSIIKYFLEKSDEHRLSLFKGLNIEKETEIMKKQGSYPVIYLTFKDDKHNDFSSFINIMKYKISDLYESFDFIYETLSNKEKKYFDSIVNIEASSDLVEISLLKLSGYLNKFYNQKVMILIDEYDTPIHEGHFKNYYSDIIGFMRNFLSSALKDNENLEKAMITGILRVAKESIFSGLNNLKVYTLLNEEFSKFFGFTEEEINIILDDFNCKNEVCEFKKWYNGYKFGDEIIYNPWSVLYYLSEKKREFKPFWVNTAENGIIKSLLAEGTEEIKVGLESLYNGGYVETEVNEDVVMSELSNGKQNLWSFLLLSGYLKPIDKRKIDDVFVYKLVIPNTEIRTMYKGIIEKWFREGLIESEYDTMIKALLLVDIKNFSKLFKRCILTSFSYFDSKGKDPEKVYHAFVLGLLISLNGNYEVVSNRESGIGRYDVSLIPKDIERVGYIFEFKTYDVEDEETIENALDDALGQIEEKKYDTELKSRGVTNIIKLGIVFNGKIVHIKQGKL